MSSGSFGCNPHDRSATRWAVYGVSVQHNIQHAQVQSSKSSCVPVKGYTVLKREQWACFMLLWDSKQRFSMCDELESKLLNSLNSPDLCLFRLLLIFHLTNKSASAWKLHGASLCQSKVRTWSSCHWASENRRPEAVVVLLGFSPGWTGNTTLTWNEFDYLKRDGPWTAFIYLNDIEMLWQQPCFPKCLDLRKNL